MGRPSSRPGSGSGLTTARLEAFPRRKPPVGGVIGCPSGSASVVRTLAISRRGVAEKCRRSPPACRGGVPGSAYRLWDVSVPLGGVTPIGIPPTNSHPGARPGATAHRGNCPSGWEANSRGSPRAAGRGSSFPEVGRSSAPTSSPNSAARRRQPSRPTVNNDSVSRPASANRGGLADDDRRATRPTTAITSPRSATSTSAGVSAETFSTCRDGVERIESDGLPELGKFAPAPRGCACKRRIASLRCGGSAGTLSAALIRCPVRA